MEWDISTSSSSSSDAFAGYPAMLKWKGSSLIAPLSDGDLMFIKNTCRVIDLNIERTWYEFPARSEGRDLGR